MNQYGLSDKQAALNLKKFGPNEVVPSRIHSLMSDLKSVLFDHPMGIVLLILGILYMILGEKTDAIVLFCAFFPVMAVDILLEMRSTRVLKSLGETLTPFAKVFRNGIVTEIPIKNIVPGDVIIFEEGQTLPVDGKIIEAENLNINEASLTGESIPINKFKNDVFLSGSTVMNGRGLGLVEKTGSHSKIGTIAKTVSQIENTLSPLKIKVDKAVKIVLVVVILLAVGLFFIEWFRTKDFIPSLIIALTLGMAAVPAEFPLVFTLYLSLGAWRLSKKGLLIKSLPSVEALGGVDIICIDKTGTLTEGTFKLVGLQKVDSTAPTDKDWQAALLACETHPIDSMEIAIHEYAKEKKSLIENWVLLFDNPFESTDKHMSHVWRKKLNSAECISMKGAVEGVLEHCDISTEDKKMVEALTETLASKGKRILGLASRFGKFSGQRLEDEKNLSFIGLLIFDDPIRESAKKAILQCQEEDIELKMLTGDHLLTAHAVANQIGLKHSDHFLFTGSQLAKMTEAERKKAYTDGSIFARVLPEQKHEMVKTLQTHGKVVAMTGDGINDTMALKLADVGISMGKSATDVARSSAKIVLLKNDFWGIVHAVFEGRKIFANLRRSFSYLISFHIPIVLLSMFPPLFGWPSLLMPIHLILLEMLVHPISAFTFEGLEHPQAGKNPKGSLLTSQQVFESVTSGVIVTAVALLIFYYNLSLGTDVARTIAIQVVLVGNIFFILAETLPIWNRRLTITTIILSVFISAIAIWSDLNHFLHLESINATQLIGPIVIALLSVAFRFIKKLKIYKKGS